MFYYSFSVSSESGEKTNAEVCCYYPQLASSDTPLTVGAQTVLAPKATLIELTTSLMPVSADNNSLSPSENAKSSLSNTPVANGNSKVSSSNKIPGILSEIPFQ
jgi:hypothetical protein